MCGIAGLWRFPGDTKNAIHRMCDALNHRGPDDEGTFFDRHVGLGHRRLSIIDLAGGHQPITNEDGSVILVFNGEIYNFQDLRHELVGKGHQFNTQTDSEVLVHLYEEDGEDMPKRLNGMFAFAIYDKKKNRIFLARDHIGIKPLYLATVGESIAFASELNAIVSIPEWQGRWKMDPDALVHFISLYYVPDPYAIYRDTQKLPPAHAAIIDEKGLKTWRYWNQRCVPIYPAMSMDEAVEELDFRLQQAIRRQMVADVPLGAFLSGGVDSSSVVAGMRQIGSDVKTFTIGFGEQEFDERPFAREVANRLGVSHTEIPVSFQAIDLINDLIPRFSEPFADSSALPTYLVSKATREHVTVALSGDGGDELFAGYLKYDNPNRERWLGAFPKNVRKHAFPWLANRLPQRLPGPGLLRSWSVDPEEYAIVDIADWRIRNVLNPDVLAASGVKTSFPLVKERSAMADGPDMQTRLQLADMAFYLPGDILTKVDRMSMAVSLETRVPMLDIDVVDFAFSLPTNLKVSDGERKVVLKRVLEKRLPKKLVRRKKQGFALPIKDWFKADLKPYLLDTLSDNSIREVGILNPKTIGQFRDDHLAGRRNETARLWQALVLMSWWRHARPSW